MSKAARTLVPTDRAISMWVRTRAMLARAARTIASKSPSAIASSRAAFHREADRDYTEAVARAVDDFCALAVSRDAQEGLRAFLDKRKPDWDGAQ